MSHLMVIALSFITTAPVASVPVDWAPPVVASSNVVDLSKINPRELSMANQQHMGKMVRRAMVTDDEFAKAFVLTVAQIIAGRAPEYPPETCGTLRCGGIIVALEQYRCLREHGDRCRIED